MFVRQLTCLFAELCFNRVLLLLALIVARVIIAQFFPHFAEKPVF
jgi:hypothetical protein